MMYYLQNLLWKIKNTWSWVKFVWSINGYYDYTTVYKILRFTLLKKIEYFESSDRVRSYVGVEHDVYYMRLCVKLIDMIETEYYNERCIDELEKRWGKYNTTIKPLNGDDTFYSMTIKRELDKTEEDSARYKEDFIRTHKYWDNKHEKAKKLLYKILQERLEGWWI